MPPMLQSFAASGTMFSKKTVQKMNYGDSGIILPKPCGHPQYKFRQGGGGDSEH